MKCSNVIVPGFEETNKIKNKPLEMKLEKLVSDAEKEKKVKKAQHNR